MWQLEIANQNPSFTPKSSSESLSETLDFLSDTPDTTMDSSLTADICHSEPTEINNIAAEMDQFRHNITSVGHYANPGHHYGTQVQGAPASDRGNTASSDYQTHTNASVAACKTLSISQIVPGRAQPTEAQLNVAFAYGIQREDGTYTRLLRADEILPVGGIPPPSGSQGLIVLPPLRNDPPANGQQSTVMVDRSVLLALPAQTDCGVQAAAQTQKAIDEIVRRNSVRPSYPVASGRRPKVYCDKWIHTGDCAFTQVGCRFKHEMPRDAATQRSLGLNNGFPVWYRRVLTPLSPGRLYSKVAAGQDYINDAAKSFFGGRNMASHSLLIDLKDRSDSSVAASETWHALERDGDSNRPEEPRYHHSNGPTRRAVAIPYSSSSSLEDAEDTDESEMVNFHGRMNSNPRG